MEMNENPGREGMMDSTLLLSVFTILGQISKRYYMILEGICFQDQATVFPNASPLSHTGELILLWFPALVFHSYPSRGSCQDCLNSRQLPQQGISRKIHV